MKPGWVAGSVRARGLARRCLGEARARSVAAAPSLREAIGLVARSPYGHDVDPSMGLVDAQRGIRAAAVWHLRILAGWLPPGKSELVRVLAGGFEIDNVAAFLDELAGWPRAEPLELGALATAWPRVRSAGSIAEVRVALKESPWGDPGTDERSGFAAAMRLAWTRRIFDEIPELSRWAAALAAVIVVEDRFGKARELDVSAAIDARRLLGPRWGEPSLEGFVAGLPMDVRWVFADIHDPASVWRAEVAWWRGIRDEASRQMTRAVKGQLVVAWSAILLVADAHRVSGALEAVPWGSTGSEDFDALA